MATQTITVNINLQGLLGELQCSLQEVICLVATGLDAEIDVETDDLVLPTTVKSSFSKLGWDKDQLNKQYNEWVLLNGFRDTIENLSSFLESSHRVLSIWALQKKQGASVSISGGEWNKIYLDGGGGFHCLGLPEKLKHIAIMHGIEIKDVYKEQVLSINVARNCYVHRRGIVSNTDANEDGVLTVKWSSLRTFLQNEDGEQELVLGKVVEKESTLCVKLEENEKSFSVGEQLSFSVEEISEIIWCCFLFGNELVMNVSKFGEDSGFIQAAEENSA